MKSHPQMLNVNRIPSQPKRRKKVTLVFDEKKRRDFLGGFHKRKLERKKKAQEDLQKQLKEERKRIKQEARERYKKLVSNQDIPELQQLLSQHEYETEGHTVSVLEVNVADLAEGNTLIGENKGNQETDEDEEEMEKGDSADSAGDSEIEGMSLTKTQSKKKSESRVKETPIETRKDLKRIIKKTALKHVKKSKIFQHKQRIEGQKNRKERLRKLKLEEKRKKKLKRKSNR